MADTEKQGFRYPIERWRDAVAKTERMREAGYDIDMTKLLTAEVDRFLAEPVERTARRLRLSAGTAPVTPYRKPFSRTRQATAKVDGPK